MTIKPAPTHTQDLLFDLPPERVFKAPAEARARYGSLVQTIVCRTLGLVEIPGSGIHDAVYDAHSPVHNRFFEIKSVHATNKIPLYRCRLQKDADSGVDPVYLLAIHRVRGAKSMSACIHAFAQSLTEVVAVSHGTIMDLCEGRQVFKIMSEVKGSRMGYERKGYCDGYVNLPVSTVRDLVPESPVRVYVPEIWGRNFSIALRCEPSLKPLFLRP
jgi:hypothetical protein